MGPLPTPCRSLGHGSIGHYGGSSGSATVWGDNALWENRASLYIGGSAGGAGGMGARTVLPGGTATVVNELVIYAGNGVYLQGGTLNAGTLVAPVGAVRWMTGNLNITGGDLTIDAGEPFANFIRLDSDRPLSVSESLNVGTTVDAVNATLDIIPGGVLSSGSGIIGNLDPGAGEATTRLMGSESSWTISGDLKVGGVDPARLSVGEGAVLSSHNTFTAQLAGTTADLILTGPDTQWDSSGSVYLAGAFGGNAKLAISSGAAMHVANTLRIWHESSAEVQTGGILTTPDLELYGGLSVGAATLEVLGGTVDVMDADANLEGDVDLQGSALTITGGGQFWGTILGDVNTHVTLQDADSLLSLDALALDGGSINAAEFDLGGADFQGFGALNGRVLGGSAVITATGDLRMGDAMDPLGFSHGGELRVGPNAVTLKASGFARAGVLTTIETPGILAAPNGLLLDNGDNLIGHGTILAPIAAGFGSTIVAWGKGELELGDPTARNGFFSDGVLEVGVRRVTLHDANAAVLGSVTTIGVVDSIGFLVAANGAVLDSGKDLTGFGIVDTPDDPTTPLINNGAIVGNAANRLIKQLAPCLTGPDGSVAPECECFDVDQSGAIDLSDVARFQAEFTGG